MNWCDKLASTPAVGFGLDPYVTSSGTLIDAFAPKLSSLVDGEKLRFTIDQSQPCSLTFTTEDGFQTAIDPAKISVSFVHRLTAKQVSGGPPRLEMLSFPRPYSELLPTVLKMLIEATTSLPSPKTRGLHRIGIVAVTGVSEEEAPPGIIRFLDYMRDPWDKVFGTYSFSIAAEVGSTSAWRDRCVHILAKGDGKDALLNLSFDWQRTFAKPRPINPKTLEEIASEAEIAALAYFEELAEGNRFDANLDRQAQ